ncbi:MAG: rane protein [Acidobacteria bacterium]|jgi:drug/metabolite transporter (DMT)-like permease|nr:rane protein [Acidobacteriota bacterium]
MSKLALSVWLGSVLLDTAGRLAFKAAAVTGATGGEWQRWRRMFCSPALWIGILCFGLEFVVWLALLSLIPLSQAILIGSINIVAVALAGRLFFRERLDAIRLGGIALITLGVALAGALG